MQTATNPDTKQKYYLDPATNKWVEIKTASNPETGEQFGLIDNKWVSIGLPKEPTKKENEGVVTKVSNTLSDASESLFGGGNYYVDKAKSGAANFVLSVLPNDVTNSLLGINIFDYQKEDGTFDTKKLNQDREAAIEDAKEAFLGYEGIKPESTVERLSGQALESVISEGPMAIVGAKGFTGGLVELLHSYTASLLGQFTAEQTATGAEYLGAPEWLQDVLGFAGGIAGGSATTGTRVVTGGALSALSKANQERKRVNESLDAATDFVASKEISNVIKKATEADPNIDSVIKATTELENEVPGLVIPPIAVLSDNPIYRKNIDYLLRTNPEFYAQASDSLKNAVEAINSRKEKLFGTSGAKADAEIRKNLPDNYASIISNAKKRMNAIDQKIATLSDKVTTSLEYVDIGSQVSKLMDAKVEAVNSRLRPQYKKLLSEADNAGVVFPADSVARIHQSFKALKNQEFFATFPTLSKKLDAEWAPKKVKPSPIIIPGVAPQKTKIQYEPVSLAEMDSFKRELNKAIRNTKDSTQLRILNNLKESFKKEVKNLPEEFGEKYSSLDMQFYTELGIPKNKAEINQLDSAKFASQVGSYLAKPEQAREFISFVGDAGIPVVKDAIFLKMQGSGLKSGGVFDSNGMIDPKALIGFINRNKTLIDTVPGLRNELTDVRKLVDNLTQTKARLDSEYNIKAKELSDGFYKAFGKKGLNEVANKILTSDAESSKILKDIKNFEPETSKMVRQGIRATLLENGIKSGDTMIDFIRKNEKVFNDWFGPTYLKSVESLGAASDIVSKINIDKMKFALDYKNQDQLLEKTGISFPQLQSVLRDRISNFTTKLAIIGSKVSTSSAAAKRDSKMMDLLLNPQALEAIKKEVDAVKIKVVDEKFMARVSQIVNNAVFKGIYFGGEAARDVAESTEEE